MPCCCSATVQTGPDMYARHALGPDKLIDLIMLDERFYRTRPADAGSGRNAILGAEQWAWFEHQVKTSDATYLVAASSSTVHTFGDEN